MARQFGGYRQFALVTLTASQFFACKGVDRLPPANEGSSGTLPTDAEASSGSEEEEGEDTGVVGEPDAPCDLPPSIHFDIAAAGMSNITLGSTRTENCAIVPRSLVGLACTGETASVGAAVGDFDGDGLPDLALTGAESAGALLRNLGNGNFEDVSGTANVDLSNASGSAWVDVDKNGTLDLFVSTWLGTRARLYMNEGSGVFVEDASARQVAQDGTISHGSSSVAVGDYDLDGWPDIYVTGWRPMAPADYNPNHLYRNLGPTSPGGFEDLRDGAGLELAGWGYEGLEEDGFYWFGYSSVFTDLNGDGRPELVAVADFDNTSVYEGLGNGTFQASESATEIFRTASYGMGQAWGDYDRDGDMDAYVTAVSDPIIAECLNDSNSSNGSRFLEQTGPLEFAGREIDTRTRCSGWGWGTVMADFDNDGLLDLTVTNGFIEQDHLQDQDRYYVGTGSFETPAQQCATEVGLSDTGQGRAMVPLDYDGDGDLDILVARAGDNPFIYENDGVGAGNYLRVQARGSVSPTSGRGARIAARSGAAQPWLVREIGLGSHYMGHGELIAHFGLGDAQTADVRICWPASGFVQEILGVSANQLLVLDEQSADIAAMGACSTVILADSL